MVLTSSTPSSHLTRTRSSPAPLKPSSVINKLSSLPYLVKIEYLPSFRPGDVTQLYIPIPTYFIIAWTFTCHIVRSSLLLVYGKTFLIYPEWCQKKPEKWWMNGKLVFYNEATQTLLGLLCMTLSLIRKKNSQCILLKSLLGHRRKKQSSHQIEPTHRMTEIKKVFRKDFSIT